MKLPIRLSIVALLLLKVLPASAQNKRAAVIEQKLIRLFARIDYWSDPQHQTASASWTDSLEKANQVFGEQLQYYAAHNPETINQSFGTLAKHITIITSPDHRFRIYSWDTQTGGTMHVFAAVWQYKVGNATKAILKNDTNMENGNYVYAYKQIYQLSAGGHNYYLATYLGVYSSKDLGEGIQAFEVRNSQLSDKANIIKTTSGMHSKLYYDYDAFASEANRTNEHVQYNGLQKTIMLPLVDSKSKVTTSHIIYKFNGKYFEKVKS